MEPEGLSWRAHYQSCSQGAGTSAAGAATQLPQSWARGPQTLLQRNAKSPSPGLSTENKQKDRDLSSA